MVSRTGDLPKTASFSKTHRVKLLAKANCVAKSYFASNQRFHFRVQFLCLKSNLHIDKTRHCFASLLFIALPTTNTVFFFFCFRTCSHVVSLLFDVRKLSAVRTVHFQCGRKQKVLLSFPTVRSHSRKNRDNMAS